jgi:protein O-GlcNAc transferase
MAADSLPNLHELAGALRGAHRWEEAADCYWRIIDIEPLSHEAHLHLGNVLARWARHRVDGAVPKPDEGGRQRAVDALLQASETALSARQPMDALRALIQAARLIPGSANIHTRIGFILWQIGALEQALVHDDLTVRFRPDWAEAYERAGDLAASLGLSDRATHYFAAARQLRPADDALSLRAALLVPAIESSTAAIQLTRDRVTTALDRLLAEPLNIAEPFPRAQLSLFYLTYHGRCNREIHGKVARLYRHACPDLAWAAPRALEPRKSPERIKVGFVSHFIRSHSIGRTTAGLVAQLSRERFEVFVINLSPNPDEMSEQVRRHADHWVCVEPPLGSAREQIAALGLDVLFYQDIGLEPFGYFLAHSRLAPVQCVSYGHPDTTGIPSMDYFISNDLYELPEAQRDYSERLFLLRDLPTLAYYYRPPAPQFPTRGRFGLPEREHLYLCPQTLFKIHPEFDELIAGILRRDPLGRVLLIRNHCEQWRVRLNERFQRSMPDVAHRVSFLPMLARQDFIALLAVADVVLDTVHFNGMNSSLEAFSVGAPVVTLPTSLQRGRHTQAMYRKMGILECVASDPQSYVDIATRVAADPVHRGDIKRRILERNAVLYENSEVTREFERFFTTAVAAAGR